MSETALGSYRQHDPPFVPGLRRCHESKPAGTDMPRRRNRSRSRLERVALRSNRPDPPRLLTLGFELGPESANVLRHGRGVLPVFGRMPHLLEQERAGENSTRRGREKREEVELASRQFNKVPIQEHSPRVEV